MDQKVQSSLTKTEKDEAKKTKMAERESGTLIHLRMEKPNEKDLKRRINGARFASHGDSMMHQDMTSGKRDKSRERKMRINLTKNLKLLLPWIHLVVCAQ